MNGTEDYCVFGLLLSVASIGDAQVAENKALTISGARTAIAPAAAEARKRYTTGVIAVVDNGGNSIALERLEDTFPAGANISIGKARTAALFKRLPKPSKTPSRMDVRRLKFTD